MQDVKISAVSLTTPEKVVSNDDLAGFMDTSDEWIYKRTGIKNRHVSSGENTSDLASSVAKKLLEKSKLTADQIDLIVVATMSPDSMTPSVGAIVQGKIAAENAVAFDISAACSGFSYALSIARSMMLVNNYQNALVIGAEVLSKLLDWQDRSTAVLFGDGAGGVVLTKTDQEHFLGQDLKTFGDLSQYLSAGELTPSEDYRENSRQLSAFKMDGRQVYKFATKEVPASIRRAADQVKLDVEDIDFFLLHQANRRIVEHVAKKLDQPLSKFPINIQEYGNTAGASEAILLTECIEKRVIKKGNTIALSGFGGGLSLATIIVKI